MRSVVVLGLILAVVSGLVYGQQKLYRWTDANGRVFYTDKPPPGEARNVEQKKLGMRAGTGPLPYETQVAMRNFPVVLFTTDCGKSCADARALLDKRGVPYVEKNAGEAAVQAEILKLTGGSTIEVPILMVGKSLTRGWEEALWNGALDTAGYPKSGQVFVPPRPKKAPTKRASPPPAAEAPASKAEPESTTPPDDAAGTKP